ncbi:hypothetical protein ZOSMA_30G00360 [Zostera marina]|uniref:NHL repeat-containing protein n=1 Tax=Zostera marina TaxID=29655 RepID=A0A0K9PC24_ZOSMR|nr:hypothetical protein ZOSMA_30G00360 [Zostera marina]
MWYFSKYIINSIQISDEFQTAAAAAIVIVGTPFYRSIFPAIEMALSSCLLRRVRKVGVYRLTVGLLEKEVWIHVLKCAIDSVAVKSNRRGVDSYGALFPSFRSEGKSINLTRKFYARRCSTLVETPNDVNTQKCFNTFIKSAFTELDEGLNYRWLNKNKSTKKVFDETAVFLVVVGAFLNNSPLLRNRDQVSMIQKAKLLQQRYSKLQVFGFEYYGSEGYVPVETNLAKSVLEEYVTFPVLLSEHDFVEVTDQSVFLLFENLESSFLRFDWNISFKDIAKEIEEFNLIQSPNSISAKRLNSYGLKQSDLTKGFYVCPSLRNLVLNYPGCVSVDECRKRLFISDSNHHRIIITDDNGKILDYIGSSPGFEDGGFESAELMRPAGSVYHADEDCLYFADSENHAIRRAHMKKRVVETIYPMVDNKTGGILGWIANKFGKNEVSQNTDPDFFIFPWHLMELVDNDLLIFNHSFETSWILNKVTGKIKGVCREAHREMISTKISSLKELVGNQLQQRTNAGASSEAFPFAGLISAITKFNDTIIFCDAASHLVSKYDCASEEIRNIQFTNLEMLVMPFWLVCPTEPVVTSIDASESADHYQQHHFSLLPGKCNIWMNINIPEGFELAAPLNEECIWIQARGSAAEVSKSEMTESEQKIGPTQQWYDELDNLVFTNQNDESDDPKAESGTEHDDLHSDTNQYDKNMLNIECSVNTSPGTSQVIISAALYLKSDQTFTPSDHLDDKDNTTRVLNMFKIPGDDVSVKLLLESGRDIKDLVFVKPLHVRINIDCTDHPLEPKSGEIISTDSNLQINVSL